MATGGKLNAAQFPAPDSAQRAGGRNKVALKPGHSLMDWIRLTHSSNDLAGTGGKILSVTPEELKKHNKKDDAWICLKGKVYNVTAYMSFHPGGDDELMKGVGKDATDLFNEVHQWVNYESMLQKCLVGRLQMPSVYLRRKLEDLVHPDCEVITGKRGSGTLEVIYQKEQKGKTWSDVGKPLPGNGSFVKAKDAEAYYRPGKLIAKQQVTHDTFLFTFELPVGTKMSVKIGHHVSLNSQVEGVDVTRNYTPVSPSLTLNAQTEEKEENERLLHFMIKIYPKGALTPLINSLEIGDNIQISDYMGDFKESRLHQCSVLVLIAAGTGFTPMARLIAWALKQDSQERFVVRNVLSNPHEDWKGDRGRVRLQLLKTFIPSEDSEAKLLICVCGPTPFTKLTLAYLEEMGYSPEAVHAFTS